MTYKQFHDAIEGFVAKSGINQKTEYGYDEYKKMYTARVGGLFMTGCSMSNKITVNQGRNHRFCVSI